MHSIQWADLIGCLLGAMAGGLVLFHAVAGYYHVRYYRRRRHDSDAWKCQPKRWPRPGQQRKAALMSSGNLALGGFITGILIYLLKHDLITMPLYFEVSDYGWAYTLGSTVALFVMMDAAAYYVHRALHLKPLFKRFHRHHHKFIATTPYVTVAVHPVELVALQAASLLPAFFIPFHAASVAIVLVYILTFNIIDHSGVVLESHLPWQGPSRYHDDHHAHFHCNFGQHLMIWDRMHGTLRVKGRTYGKHVFGGRGKAQAGQDESPPGTRESRDDGFRGYGSKA